MKNYKLFAAALLCAGATLLAAAPLRAQIKGDPRDAFVVVKQKPPKGTWLRGEVIHADDHTIMIREEDNPLMIHTFTYADKAKDKMAKVLDQGGYQSGDRVKILWMPGSTQALNIKGKPSKPI
ncbi:MAG: hypothetical protein WA192_18230 [Candidatus Acidiferrales bacterium]